MRKRASHPNCPRRKSTSANITSTRTNTITITAKNASMRKNIRASISIRKKRSTDTRRRANPIANTANQVLSLPARVIAAAAKIKRKKRKELLRRMRTQTGAKLMKAVRSD
jgi:hypothetical protein